MLTVYRGTGAEGLANMRPSEGGVYGPGVYFYDNLKDATVYSEVGGGVIVGQVDTSSPGVKVIEKPVTMPGTSIVLRNTKVVVVPDPKIVTVLKIIPNDQT